MNVAARVRNLLPGDTGGDQARSVGNAVIGITQALEDWRPDIVIVLGDRGEMLAGAILVESSDVASGDLALVRAE